MAHLPAEAHDTQPSAAYILLQQGVHNLSSGSAVHKLARASQSLRLLCCGILVRHLYQHSLNSRPTAALGRADVLCIICQYSQALQT